MARKKSVYVPVYDVPHPTVGTRIRIPQPKYRPIKLFAKDAVKREALKGNSQWFVLHRRGLMRPNLGEDPQEKRAVPDTYVRGSLGERIVFKSLMTFGFVPDLDFDFQSSQSGGRMEFGGIVADFLFEMLRVILQVQSDFHTFPLQAKRDEEQLMILTDMGYAVYYLEDAVIKNEFRLENELRRIFGFNMSTSHGAVDLGVDHDDIWTHVYQETVNTYTLVQELKDAWLVP